MRLLPSIISAGVHPQLKPQEKRDSDLKLLWCTSAHCKEEGEIKTGACKCDSV
jgi:hypothetical protein